MLTLRIANLCCQIVLLGQDIVADTSEVCTNLVREQIHCKAIITCSLECSVEIYFDDTIRDSFRKLFLVSPKYNKMRETRTSCFVLPEPPWKTRNTGFESEAPIFSLTLMWISTVKI